jgi:hypothetical protein
MADHASDPFEGLVLDDAFVRAARYIEPPASGPRGRRRAVRSVRRCAGLALHTVISAIAVLVLAVVSLTGVGSTGTRPGGTGSGGAGTGGTGAASTVGGSPPAAEPWINPVSELTVNVDPDWTAIGLPATD